MKIETGLTFDDLLIVPNYSDVASRADVDLTTKIGRHTTLKLPVIAANMSDLTGVDMAVAMHKAGGIACLPRFMSIEENVTTSLYLRERGVEHWVSVGVGSEESKRRNELIKSGVNTIVIDVAHGNSAQLKEFLYQSIYLFPEVDFIPGNFVEWPSWLEPDNAVIKVGVGPGSVCTTRIKTGCGYPQASAILNCATEGAVIADGGCKTPGDIAKALALGADAVMLGGMLARTDKAANGQFFGGSASKRAYELQGKDAAHRTAEGASFFKGETLSFEDVIKDIEGGLRSAFSYVGARNLREFQRKARFVQVTSNGGRENGAHFGG